jgi:hypothetical protein
LERQHPAKRAVAWSLTVQELRSCAVPDRALQRERVILNAFRCDRTHLHRLRHMRA